MAYSQCSIVEGGKGSFQADAAGAISLYQRVKFSTTPDAHGAKPTIVVCGATDRAIGVAMQPIAVGAFGTVRLANAQGEQYGLSLGSIGLGVPVYGAALGAISASSGGGALRCGISTIASSDGGPTTYLPDQQIT